MPDIWCDVDAALSEVPVNKMPLIASADFTTIDETIAYNESGMDLNWNFLTTGGAYTQTNVTPTTGGDYDWAHQGNGMYSIEIPASGGASINNDTEGFGWFSGVCAAVLPWIGPTIGFRAAALNNALIDGGDTLDVNVTTIEDTDATDAIDARLTNYDAVVPGDLPTNFGDLAITATTGLVDVNDKTGFALVDNAITAAKIAADAIGASELATDAVNEIVAAVWAAATRTLTAGTNLNDLSAADVNAEVDTALGDYNGPTYDELKAFVQLLARSDAAITTDRATELGEINANEGSGAGDYAATADSLEASQAEHDATQSAVSGLSVPTAADNADAVWNEAQGDHVSAGSFGEIASEIASILTDTGTTLDGKVDAIQAVTDNLPDNGALTSLAQAAKLQAYVQLLARSDAAIATDNSTELSEINANGGSGAGDYDNTSDSVEAVRDRGDAAWTTGGGGSLTQVIKPYFVIPASIDLADTATVRFGIVLTNAVDDLPSTAEITPGTITIARKAIGGTSWTNVVSAAAMSEQDGMVYYDEVFDSGSGYAEGDSIRVQFESVSVTADANTFNVTGATGVFFQTFIRETERGTDSAYTGTPPTAAAIADAIWDEAKAGHVGAGSFGEEVQAHALSSEISGLENLSQAEAQTAAAAALTAYDPPTKAELDSGLAALNDPTAAVIADAVWDESTTGHVTAGTFGEQAKTDIDAILADTNELQGDLTDGGRLDLLIDAILADTNELQSDDVPGLIAALENLSAAQVNAQVLDVLNTDTFAEPGSVPAATATLVQKIGWLYILSRNKMTQTATTTTLRNDADSGDVATSTVSDDGTTFTRGEFA